MNIYCKRCGCSYPAGAFRRVATRVGWGMGEGAGPRLREPDLYKHGRCREFVLISEDLAELFRVKEQVT